MICPFCHKDSKGLILETRTSDNEIYRRRACAHCSKSVVSKEVISADFKMPPQQRVKKPAKLPGEISREIFKRWY